MGPPSVSRLAAKKDVKGLIKALQYPKDAAIPVASASALGELRDPQAVEALLRAHRQLGAPALDALVRIGTPAVEPLIGALHEYYSEHSYEVRECATQALVRIGASAVEPLIGALHDHSHDEASDEARECAAKALSRIADPRATRPLISALVDKKYGVRAYAADALGSIGDPSAVEPLIGVLGDNSDLVREWAAEAIVKLGGPRAVEPLMHALAITGPDGARARSGVADALAKIGAPAVGPLIAFLKGPARAGRRTAADALDRLGWKPDAGEAGAAYWAAKGQWSTCARIGAPAVAPLSRMLRDHPGAVQALREIGSPAVEQLITALTDPGEDTRQCAVAALGELGDPRSVEPLIATLDAPGHHQAVRRAAAQALGKIRDGRAVEPLAAALDDTSAAVRRAAARALGQIADPRAIKALIRALDDADNEVRMIAAHVLEAWEAPVGAGALRPRHYWVPERDSKRLDEHRLIFPCPDCGVLTTIPFASAFGQSPVHQACGQPMTVPSVPCTERSSCHGLYRQCGGKIKEIITPDMEFGRDEIHTFNTTKDICEACGHDYYGRAGRCAEFRCSTCGQFADDLKYSTFREGW